MIECEQNDVDENEVNVKNSEDEREYVEMK